MRLAQLGDLHIVERDDDAHATLEEQLSTLLWVASDAKAAGAELILCGGDVFDAESAPAERNTAISVFTALAEVAPVAVTAGNHDRPGDLRFLSRLRTKHPILVFESPDVVDIGGARVAMLPWPRKANLVAALGSTDALEIGDAVGSALRSILLGFRLKLQESKLPTVLLGHVELGGAKLDNGQPVVGRCDITLSEGDLLDVGADVVCLSHIHLHQILGGGRIVYAGAPRPTRFGEAAAKGYCLIDVRRGEVPVIEHRKAPYRELLTIDAAWSPERGGLTVDPESPVGTHGAAVRISYVVDEANRAAAATQAEQMRDKLLASGAASVKLDAEITAVHRVRSEAITKAVTTAERVRAYWQSRGAEPARADAILAKLNQIEAA